MFKITIRYVCDACDWRWTREVRSKVAVNMDRPIAVAKCPGCEED